jgi:hypothetical protein
MERSPVLQLPHLSDTVIGITMKVTYKVRIDMFEFDLIYQRRFMHFPHRMIQNIPHYNCTRPCPPRSILFNLRAVVIYHC